MEEKRKRDCIKLCNMNILTENILIGSRETFNRENRLSDDDELRRTLKTCNVRWCMCMCVYVCVCVCVCVCVHVYMHACLGAPVSV